MSTNEADAATGSQEIGEITGILEEWKRGTDGALERLMPIVIDKLRAVAGNYSNKYRQRGADPTLEPSALVNEAFLKMSDGQNPALKNREEFFAFCSRVIRNILIDYIRKTQADIRGGNVEKVPLDDVLVNLSWVKKNNSGSLADMLTVHEVLNRMEAKYPRASQVVDQKYFMELTDEKIAENLDISVPTVQRDLKFARAWIRLEISRQASDIFQRAKKIGDPAARKKYLETACAGNPSLLKDVELLLRKEGE